jgi:hypothetical protein
MRFSKALVNLAATSDHGCELPGKGWLDLFVELGDGTLEDGAKDAHGVLDVPAAFPDAAEPAALHAELVIPRRWHEAMDALHLDDPELDASGSGACPGPAIARDVHAEDIQLDKLARQLTRERALLEAVADIPNDLPLHEPSDRVRISRSSSLSR